MSVSEYRKILYALNKDRMWLLGIGMVTNLPSTIISSIVAQRMFFSVILMYHLSTELFIYRMHNDLNSGFVERLNNVLPINKSLVVKSYLSMRRYTYIFSILMIVAGVVNIVNPTVAGAGFMLVSILLLMQTIFCTYKMKVFDNGFFKNVNYKFFVVVYILFSVFLAFCELGDVEKHIYNLLGEGKALYGVVIIIVMTISLVICENKRRNIIKNLK
ncbi:MAG: hypothetical protein IKK88_04515 [Oscillospiraceae bacterium]|nr:hypothetical protein [Oscillospiraceae bacterium]